MPGEVFYLFWFRIRVVLKKQCLSFLHCKRGGLFEQIPSVMNISFMRGYSPPPLCMDRDNLVDSDSFQVCPTGYASNTWNTIRLLDPVDLGES
mmetsp:Transcript_18977/g.76140  ORF Transcript_18977/g.76140 Transcript_18977/m.76140 type:complete len:93 (+) Transcript_18977:162-440(+)